MYLCIFFWNWLWPDRQFAAPGTKCRWHHRHVELAGLLRDYQYVGGLGAANFFGGLTIGLVSVIIAHLKKMPSILFDVPGLVPLVPGGQAYNTIKNFAMGNYQVAFNYLSEVVWIAGSIALGFIVAELINKIRIKIKYATRLRNR